MGGGGETEDDAEQPLLAVASDPAADAPRRLAFVITRSDSVGGAQVCVQGLAEGMRDAGHQVRVFVGAPRGTEAPFVDRMRDAGLDVETLPQLIRAIRPGTDLRGLLQLRAALARFDPDLVSAHSTKAGWLARAAAKSLGKPAIFTAHGWLFGPGKLRGRAAVAKLAEQVTAPLADAIVTVSDWDRNAALVHGVARPDKLITVYNAVPDVPPALRADPTRQPPRLVSVARLEAPKDPITLLEAAALLRDDPKLAKIPWTLELIGDGPLRAAVEAKLAQLRLQDRVQLLGTRNDVPARLAEAQIFVLTSRHEGFPISILEAMRAGLPVVSSDVGGVSEALGRAGERGRLVPAGDAVALFGVLGELIADPQLRGRLGGAARGDYEGRFTFQRHLQRTWGVYRSVL